MCSIRKWRNDLNKTVVITGVSSGIGKGYAYEFASQGYNLLLIARNEEKLNNVKVDIEEKYQVLVSVFIADLSELNAAEKVTDYIQENKLETDVLINNAGFSTKGWFDQEESQDQHNELMVTLTELAHLFTREWRDKKKGTIINVASAAGFHPAPFSAVYSATKAYVLSLTEFLNQEYKKQGIYFLAVCPGEFMGNIGSK